MAQTRTTSTSNDQAGPRPTYGSSAARGAAWVMLASAGVQFLSFISQLVLGYLLAREEFGVYALALSFSNLIVILRNGGMHRILLQRPGQFAVIAPWAFRIALGFNLGAAALISAAAFPLARFYDEPRLVWMLGVIASSLPLQSPTVIYRARLLIGLRYRAVSQIDAAAAGVRYGSMIAFALLGLGPLSFVLPMPISSLFEWGCCRWVTPPHPTPAAATNDRRIVRTLLADARWVLLGSLTMAWTLQSDKLVVGKLQSIEFLGIYFFGHQLVLGLARPLIGSLSQVLMPTLSHLSNEPERLSQAYLKVARALVLCSAAVCFGMAAVAEPLVHLIWSGKWDESVPVLQVFACGLPLLFLSAAAATLIESRGRWRDTAWIQAAQGILSAVAAYLGASTNSAAFTAFCVVSVGIVVAAIKHTWASQLVGLKPLRIVPKLAPSLLTPALCALVTWAVVSDDIGSLARVCLSVALYGTMLAFVCLTYLRQPLEELLSYVARQRA